MEANPEIAKPLLQPLLDISNREFKEKYGKVSGSWRGKKPIQRNAILALGHFKEQSAVGDLIKVLNEDVRPEIRGTAAWSLGKIGGEQAKEALIRAQAEENDSLVLKEINKGLQLLE